mmetsp:Transcript_51133/g.157696  ORF Transcript_51133/g.157696 Transcript_51133/m.157696 type:complete len:212 (-) Transcript_51133:412-1047(-)
MSRPRAATSVAMRNLAKPALNIARLFRRCCCVSRELSDATGKPSSCSVRRTTSQRTHELTKMIADCALSRVRSRHTRNCSLTCSGTKMYSWARFGATVRMARSACSVSDDVQHTARVPASVTPSCGSRPSAGSVSSVLTVALSMSVRRNGFGAPSAATAARVSSRMSPSTRRSASSSTRKATLRAAAVASGNVSKSIRSRPGVPTTTCGRA